MHWVLYTLAYTGDSETETNRIMLSEDQQDKSHNEEEQEDNSIKKARAGVPKYLTQNETPAVGNLNMFTCSLFVMLILKERRYPWDIYHTVNCCVLLFQYFITAFDHDITRLIKSSEANCLTVLIHWRPQMCVEICRSLP